MDLITWKTGEEELMEKIELLKEQKRSCKTLDEINTELDSHQIKLERMVAARLEADKNR